MDSPVRPGVRGTRLGEAELAGARGGAAPPIRIESAAKRLRFEETRNEVPPRWTSPPCREFAVHCPVRPGARGIRLGERSSDAIDWRAAREHEHEGAGHDTRLRPRAATPRLAAAGGRPAARRGLRQRAQAVLLRAVVPGRGGRRVPARRAAPVPAAHQAVRGGAALQPASDRLPTVAVRVQLLLVPDVVGEAAAHAPRADGAPARGRAPGRERLAGVPG